MVQFRPQIFWYGRQPFGFQQRDKLRIGEQLAEGTDDESQFALANARLADQFSLALAFTFIDGDHLVS